MRFQALFVLIMTLSAQSVPAQGCDYEVVKANSDGLVANLFLPIGLVGGSRGAELALLLASMEPRIKSVVATTPSSVAWYGRNTAASAWTFKGKDIPALGLELDEQAPMLSRFEAALNDPEKVSKAFFGVEKIRGPILLISAENDQVWPSYRMANDLATYLEKRGFNYAVVHKSYATGHGFSAATAPKIKQAIIDHFIRTLRR